MSISKICNFSPIYSETSSLRREAVPFSGNQIPLEISADVPDSEGAIFFEWIADGTGHSIEIFRGRIFIAFIQLLIIQPENRAVNQQSAK